MHLLHICKEGTAGTPLMAESCQSDRFTDRFLPHYGLAIWEIPISSDLCVANRGISAHKSTSFLNQPHVCRIGSAQQLVECVLFRAKRHQENTLNLNEWTFAQISSVLFLLNVYFYAQIVDINTHSTKSACFRIGEHAPETNSLRRDQDVSCYQA